MFPCRCYSFKVVPCYNTSKAYLTLVRRIPQTVFVALLPAGELAPHGCKMWRCASKRINTPWKFPKNLNNPKKGMEVSGPLSKKIQVTNAYHTFCVVFTIRISLRFLGAFVVAKNFTKKFLTKKTAAWHFLSRRCQSSKTVKFVNIGGFTWMDHGECR